MSRDYGLEAQKAAEDHLEACENAYAGVPLPDEGEDPWPDYPDNMAGPYDGCTTCLVREVLHAAYPILREGILAEARGEG